MARKKATDDDTRELIAYNNTERPVEDKKALRESIDEQVRRFKEGGGRITQVTPGESGAVRKPYGYWGVDSPESA